MPDPKLTATEAAENASDTDETSESTSLAESGESSEASESGEGEGTSESSTTEEESSTSTGNVDEGESDDLSEFLGRISDGEGEGESKRDNVQRRIDKLTAELKSLKSENEQLRQSTQDKKGEPEYNDAQLRGALKKAFDEGDSELAFDIFDYKVKQMEKGLVKRYEDEQRGRAEAVNRVQTEWNKVVTDYSRVWEDEKGKEIYAGAKNELDIGSESSLLYRLALEFWNMVDDDGKRPYQIVGGQRTAVADALAAILRKRKLSPTSEKKKLERALAKEKRKKSLAGTGSLEEERTSRKPSSDREKLEDYVAERRKFKNERE